MFRHLYLLLRPAFIGVLSYAACLLVLWYWFGLLSLFAGEQYLLLLPFLCILPSLIVSGYIAGKLALTHQVQHGFIVGCVSFLITQALSVKPAPDIGWLATATFIVAIVLAGGFTSAIGGWMAKRHASHSNSNTTPTPKVPTAE